MKHETEAPKKTPRSHPLRRAKTHQTKTHATKNHDHPTVRHTRAAARHKKSATHAQAHTQIHKQTPKQTHGHTDAPKTAPTNKGKIYLWLIVSIVATLAVVAGFAFYHHSQIEKKADGLNKAQQAGLKFEVATVQLSKDQKQILLTGETRAFYSVTIYARVSGYLDKLLVEIGDKVTKGQLLAHVQSPEQEQSYVSARADAINKSRINRRVQILKRQNLVSQQQADQTKAEADVAQANFRTQSVMRDYQNVTAPFDGIISNRFVDPGSLLQNASGSQSASQPLFTLTQSDPIRIFVYIDQKDAPLVHVGDPVEISVADPATKPMAARITMIANELDPQTRTLLAEILLTKNGDAPLPVTAGSYVQVKMVVKTESLPQLPSQALVMREQQAYLGVLDQKNTIHFVKIDLAENDGETILIRSGIKAGQKVVLEEGNTVAEGQKIQPVESKQKSGQAQPDQDKKKPAGASESKEQAQQ